VIEEPDIEIGAGVSSKGMYIHHLFTTRLTQPSYQSACTN
jgi:hypothetical protein